LEHEEQDLRLGAAWALTELSWRGAASIEPTIATLLEHSSWEMRYWAARKLAQHKESYAVFERVVAEEPVAEVQRLAQLVHVQKAWFEYPDRNWLLSSKFKNLGEHLKGEDDNDYWDESAVYFFQRHGEVVVIYLVLLLRQSFEARSEKAKAARYDLKYQFRGWLPKDISYGLETQVDPHERLEHKLPEDMLDWTPPWLLEESSVRLQRQHGLALLMESNSRVALSTLESCAKLPEYAELRPEIEAAISRIKQQAS
jgi:hypothetical protein